MKLKTLLIVVALLAAASVAVYVVNRPRTPAPADPRVGQPLIDSAVLEDADRFRLTDGGNTVELARQPDGTWRVATFHDLPADFSKLSRLVKDLTAARLDSFVTSNPERLSRLEFDDTTLSLAKDGTTLWSVTLGKSAEGGGRFIRLGDEQKAYRTRFSAWLDSTPRNWADSRLVALEGSQVARVEVSLPEGEALRLTRPTADEPFTAEQAPEGQSVRTSAVDSLISSLASLRFTDVTPADDADAVAARAHQRTVSLTTFDGKSVTIGLGRRPEETRVKPTEPDPETSGPAAIVGSTSEDPKPEEGGPAGITAATTETTPAGPVFAFVSGDPALATLAGAPDSIAFKVSDYVFTSLPASRDAWFEAPAEPSEPTPPAP